MITVCIPARDEAALIGQTLTALGAQRGFDGRSLRPGTFDIVVYANDCRDGTADVVRAFARARPDVTIEVIEGRLPAGHAHIGSARKHVMDLAALRYLQRGRRDAILASIDSDTLPADDWIAAIAHEMHGRDAVAGQVAIAAADRAALLAPVRLLYARERAYRRALAEAEAAIDPRPEDPLPRHNVFVGASFAVAVNAYVAAGGIPPLPRLEDLAFSRALRRIDARVRHSSLVRAVTSARIDARVSGGFGGFLADLHRCAERGVSHLVEDPRTSLAICTTRAAIRRIWSDGALRGDAARADVLGVSERLGVAPAIWLPLVDRELPVGTVFERVLGCARARWCSYADVPVESALLTLRTFGPGTSRVPLGGAANAARPIRTSAASGAG